ncbi:MAG: 16S rRNA (cytidine(1402)-2'-O)-methyltransferase [Syntrophobacteraceae bacterium]
MHSKRGNDQGCPAGDDRGALHLVSTPIGNLRDITLRALDTLRSVDLIAAEDTRHTRKLLSHYDIHKPLVSYHSHNMEHRGEELLARLAEGKHVALVTDAGTPGISDPGALLARQAIEAGLRVEAIPGPTALVTALVLSGLSTHPFAFLGFPPARGSNRRRFFTEYSRLPMTCILYEAASRLHRTLDDLAAAWGDRTLAVARELTKRYEEVFRGSIGDAATHFAGEIRGELTLVVSGSTSDPIASEAKDHWEESLRKLMIQEGIRAREAVGRIVAEFGMSRKVVYEAALKIRGELD